PTRLRRPADFVQWATAEPARHSVRMLAQAALALAMYQANEWMTDLNVPTAVVVTTHDRSVPPAMQLRMAESIRHSSVHFVDGGHAACVRRRFAQPLLTRAPRSRLGLPSDRLTVHQPFDDRARCGARQRQDNS